METRTNIPGVWTEDRENQDLKVPSKINIQRHHQYTEASLLLMVLLVILRSPAGSLRVLGERKWQGTITPRDEATGMRTQVRPVGGERTGGRDTVLSEDDLAAISDRLTMRRRSRARVLTSTQPALAPRRITHRYAREYALERLGLLVLGLVALEDALDVRAEHTLVRVEGLELLAEPGVEGARRDRHRARPAWSAAAASSRAPTGVGRKGRGVVAMTPHRHPSGVTSSRDLERDRAGDPGSVISMTARASSPASSRFIRSYGTRSPFAPRGTRDITSRVADTHDVANAAPFLFLERISGACAP